MTIQYLIIACLSFAFVFGAQWPVPYERVSSRPTNNPYCQAGLITFCPNGKAEDAMIYAQDDDDTIEIFALKKPVWSFKFGDLMAKFKIMHDALGFRSQKTGRNWTMEWYELDQLFNCTFPHVLENDTFIWCDQGALCVYDGIVDSMWNGSSDLSMLKKVAQIDGKDYNAWATWAVSDNNTGVYYETWTAYSDPGEYFPLQVLLSQMDIAMAIRVDFSDHPGLKVHAVAFLHGQYRTSEKGFFLLAGPNATMYFDSYDCASFVIRGLDQLSHYGAQILPNVHLNYTRLNIYTDEPQLLGTYDQIIRNETLHADFVNFYREFDSKKPKKEDWVKALVQIYETFYLTRRFYFYYNNVYWYMKLKASTPLEVSFDEVPIGSLLNKIK